jgi:M6 family metalloprotease-like protein
MAPTTKPTLQKMKRKMMQMNVNKDLMSRAGTGKKDFRGLLLLVNFNDRKFSRGEADTKRYFNAIMNEPSLTVFHDPIQGEMEFTGSVRDYFSDNSYGKFKPEFDVVGPISIDESQYFINGVDNTFELMEKVLKEADKQVDFSKYDSDNDGVVDMFYIVYAGYAANYGGNDQRLVWPHAGDFDEDQSEDPSENIEPLILDGKKMGRFACSAEINGYESEHKNELEGIGVIVHEFSHVLGFQDHYDTSSSNLEDPNAWDLMAAGNYSDNYNRTPVGWNSYERYSAGFICLEDISSYDDETINIQSLETSENACMIRSLQKNITFFMENRQPDKWDKNLPGHGMLVWYVDSTDTRYWDYNVVNATPRSCFRLVRAGGTQGNSLVGVMDTDFDPFPGTRGITSITNETTPANFVSYDGYPCPAVLDGISENNGIISIHVTQDSLAEERPITYEIPEKLTARGERLVGDQWVPQTWTVTHTTVNNKDVLLNVIPNDANITSTDYDYSKGVIAEYTTDNKHTMVIRAQRVALNNSCGTWLCDLDNVQKQGAGNSSLNISRYGIPAFVTSDVQLGFVTEKPTAFMVTQKNIQNVLSVYRNIVFTEYDPEATSIDKIETSEKVLTDNNIYNLQGQRVLNTISGHIYIINHQKVIAK